MQIEVRLTKPQIAHIMRKLSRKWSWGAYIEMRLEDILAEALIEYAEERTGTFMRTTPTLDNFIKETLDSLGE